MTTDVFKARLAAQTDLIRKPDFDSKLKGISDRVTKNKTKYLLVENERLYSITASNYKITPELSFYDTKTRVEFNGSCLKQDKVTLNHGAIVNIYIAYNISSYLTLENLFLWSC